MAAPEPGSNVRENALRQIEKNERTFKRLIGLAGVVEAACLVSYLLLMNFGDRTHWLILIAAVLVYVTLSVGLFAHGAHSTAGTHRVLKAIDLLHEALDSRADDRRAG